MKLIITESQYKVLCEHTLYTSYLERTSGDEKKTKERQEFFGNVVTEYEKNYPVAFKLTWMIGLWLTGGVPGRILLGILNTVTGAKKINEGIKTKDNDKVIEGIIEFISGPASFSMALHGMKLLGFTGAKYSILKTIQVTGIPVLIGQGMESFMKWGYKTIGPDFKYVMSYLNNDGGHLQKLLSQYAVVKDKDISQQATDARKGAINISDKF